MSMHHAPRIKSLSQPKRLVIFFVAVVLLIITAFIDWSLWTWIGLGGLVLVAVGWKMKK